MAPRDVKPGAQYADAIVRAISDAKALVLVLSVSAVGSAHVGREIERAASKRKQIIALKIDAALLTPALEYFLSESQWIDVAAVGMPAALAKLTEAVRLGSPAAQLNPVSSTGNRGGSGGPPVNRPPGTANVAKQVMIATAAVVLLGVAGTLAVHFWPANHPGAQAPAVAAISDKSIAVLPFADMSEKKDQEYFADGMAEEILDLLARIPGLTVIGRTSSFQFKGKNEDLRTIGAKLNAAYVLEGSVRNSGDQVRITAQLINTKTGAHEWSESYDRPIGDVLKLQDAIASAVVRELQLTVAPEHLNSRSTMSDADAYVLLLRGRHAADRFDREGLDEAIALFKQVVERDPKSADAFAELAFAYYAEGINNFLSSTAAFEPARRAAETALGLNSKSALAHYVLGKIHVVFDWDWAAAEREFNQIATQAPGSAYAQGGAALLSMALGRWDDALRHIEASLALDPLDPDVYQNLMEIQLGRGRLPEAEAAIRRSLDIRPTYGFGHFLLGYVKLHRGDPDGALLEMQQETTEAGQQEGLAMAYFALGRKVDSDAALARMLKEYPGRSAYSIAAVYAFRGQSDEAMLWLERAYAEKDAFLQFAKAELSHMHLAEDPRYKAFLKKINLPE
jgi:TolB-like protein/Tfp pilus assembly protein PilF